MYMCHDICVKINPIFLILIIFKIVYKPKYTLTLPGKKMKIWFRYIKSAAIMCNDCNVGKWKYLCVAADGRSGILSNESTYLVSMKQTVD